jgi:hypothetical protein
MTDKAVSALTSLTGANTATGDLLYIVDISEAAAADRSKKITAEELQNYLKKFPATIGVGGATPAASGAGISFPATASASSDANTLDDYEEGTWTPSLIGSSSSPTITYDYRSGIYIKIGRLVIAQFGIKVNSISGGSGAAQISGLPFTSGAYGPYQEPNATIQGGVFVTAGYAGQLYLYIVNTSTTAEFRYQDNADTAILLTGFQGGTYFSSTLIYQI